MEMSTRRRFAIPPDQGESFILRNANQLWSILVVLEEGDAEDRKKYGGVLELGSVMDRAHRGCRVPTIRFDNVLRGGC